MEPTLRKELDTCRKENGRLVKKVKSLKCLLKNKTHEKADFKGRLEAEVEGRLEDQNHHKQELALASERMAELETFKCELELKLKDYHNTEQQKTDLEREVQSLIKENLSLKSSKEELNVQLVERQPLQQGSLADELVTADDKEEIISTLREKKEENRRLKGYLDSLLKKIIEHDPARKKKRTGE